MQNDQLSGKLKSVFSRLNAQHQQFLIDYAEKLLDYQIEIFGEETVNVEQCIDLEDVVSIPHKEYLKTAFEVLKEKDGPIPFPELTKAVVEAFPQKNSSTVKRELAKAVKLYKDKFVLEVINHNERTIANK